MTEPKIRFKRDDGRAFPDWEQVPFGDVIEQYSERTKTENEDTLLSCAIEGLYLNSELFGHQRGSSTIGYKKIDKGTLILSAQNLHLGNANVNLRFEHGMISPAYNTYHIKGCDVNFMAQWIKREATKKFFFDATTTGASECRRNVMWDELYKQKIGVPSLPEQHKIADFLSDVDEVIVASEEEVANLEQQKKAVMQKIFSQEVRFKKEDGNDFPDWDEKTFEELAKYKKGPFGSALKKEIFVPEGSDTVKVYEQQNAIGKDWTLKRYFITAEYYKKMQSFEVRAGDIIVSCAGTIGEIYILPENAQNGVINQALMRVRENKAVVNQVYFTYIFDQMLSQEGQKLSNGSALKNIPPFADMKKQVVKVPSLPEQQKIADFLTSYDEAITAAKQELAKWKELKKGLLQQMFV